MPDPIASFSPEAVIEAIEANLIDSSLAMGRTEDGVVFRGSDVTWVYTGYPALNRVLRARFTEHEAEDRVAEIAECFRQWNAPVMWITGPSSFPPDLGDHLRESGFITSETWMGMATDLNNLPHLTSPASLRIELVTEPEQLKDWTALSSEMWTGEAKAGAMSIFTPENAGSDPRCRFYLGYVNGKPTVRGLVCNVGETAGLYWVNSKPEFADAGHDFALAVRALSDARDSGARMGVMAVRTHSTLAQRLGLKPYCQFNAYAWPASSLKTPVC